MLLSVNGLLSVIKSIIFVNFLNSPKLVKRNLFISYHRRATLMGVVRQDVNKSAGRSGFIGKCSVLPQAASRILFLTLDGALVSLVTAMLF